MQASTILNDSQKNVDLKTLQQYSLNYYINCTLLQKGLSGTATEIYIVMSISIFGMLNNLSHHDDVKFGILGAHLAVKYITFSIFGKN